MEAGHTKRVLYDEGMGSVIPIKLPARRNEKTSFSGFEGLRAKLALRKREKSPLLYKPKISVFGYRILSKIRFSQNRVLGK